MSTAAAAGTAGIRWGTPQAWWVLGATVGASGLAMLDATTVNVALPAIGTDLDATVAGLQWTINAYTLSLASLILLAGSLADRYGRIRVFQIGIAWFALASVLCAAAPTTGALILARALQGIGGALADSHLLRPDPLGESGPHGLAAARTPAAAARGGRQGLI